MIRSVGKIKSAFGYCPLRHARRFIQLPASSVLDFGDAGAIRHSKRKTNEDPRVTPAEIELQVKIRRDAGNDPLSDYDGIVWKHLGDGTAISAMGMTKAAQSNIASFEDGSTGLIVGLRPKHVNIATFKKRVPRLGNSVTLGGPVSCKIGHQLLGRAVDPLGNTIDGLSPVEGKLETAEMFQKGLKITELGRVKDQIWSGLKALDFFYPLARGYKLALSCPKTFVSQASDVAVDAIIAQKSSNHSAKSVQDIIHCIYVMVGKSKAEQGRIFEKLVRGGAMSYTTVVCANEDDSDGLKYVAPWSGVTMAEYYRNRGMQCLLVFDDCTTHAIVASKLFRVLRGHSKFTLFHAPIIERCQQLSEEDGGGSIGAICIAQQDALVAEDIYTYDPYEDIISTCDLHVPLSDEMESYPFIDGAMVQSHSGTSLSCRFHNGAIRALTERVKYLLRQSSETAEAIAKRGQLGVSVDEHIARNLSHRNKLRNMFCQERSLSVTEMFACLYAYGTDYLQYIREDKLGEYEKGFCEFLKSEPLWDVLESVDLNQEIPVDVENELHKQIGIFIRDNSQISTFNTSELPSSMILSK